MLLPFLRESPAPQTRAPLLPTRVSAPCQALDARWDGHSRDTGGAAHMGGVCYSSLTVCPSLLGRQLSEEEELCWFCPSIEPKSPGQCQVPGQNPVNIL